jgi:hypothetical protein
MGFQEVLVFHRLMLVARLAHITKNNIEKLINKKKLINCIKEQNDSTSTRKF